MCQLAYSADRGQEQGEQPCAKKLLLDELKAAIRAQEGQGQEHLQLMSEMKEYCSYQPTPAEEKDALLFWKHHCNKYPHLAVLAKEYLCIPASSVSVESMFSTTGLILNSRRSSLDPVNMNIIVFIHDNINNINNFNE